MQDRANVQKPVGFTYQTLESVTALDTCYYNYLKCLDNDQGKVLFAKSIDLVQ